MTISRVGAVVGMMGAVVSWCNTVRMKSCDCGRALLQAALSSAQRRGQRCVAQDLHGLGVAEAAQS